MIRNNFVRVKGGDNPEPIELPLELDNTLSLSVLSSQFPNSTGLKYKNPKNNQIRSVRRSDGKFFLSPDLRWDDYIFFSVSPQSKLKQIQHGSNKSMKSRKHETLITIYRKFPETFDLIAMGMSYDTTQSDLENYLSQFGKLIYCEIKYDETFGYSRGVAFFRFTEIRAQNLCLSSSHVVDKTKVIIKIPNEKINIKDSIASKLYVSNVPNNLTRENVRAYFSQYGQVIHVFLPPNKRCFAFVTFLDSQAIERVLNDGQIHSIIGARVNVSRVMGKGELVKDNSCPSLNNKISQQKTCKRRIQNEDNVEESKKPITTDHLNNFSTSQFQPTISPLFIVPNFSQPPPQSFPQMCNPPPPLAQSYNDYIAPSMFSSQTQSSASSSFPFLSTSPYSETQPNLSIPNATFPSALQSYPNGDFSQMLPQTSRISESFLEKIPIFPGPQHLTKNSFESLMISKVIQNQQQPRKQLQNGKHGQIVIM